MELINKEVQYYKYCIRCKHYATPETEEPCNECLTVSMKEYSHKPIRFEEAIKDNA